MTEPTIALKEYLNKIGMHKDADFLRWRSRLERRNMSGQESAATTAMATRSVSGKRE
jgi:hypothetical protein